MRKFFVSIAIMFASLPQYNLAQSAPGDLAGKDYVVVCSSSLEGETVLTVWKEDGPVAMLELMTQYRLLVIETGNLACTIRSSISFTQVEHLKFRGIYSTSAAGKLHHYDIVFGTNEYALISTYPYRLFGGSVVPE
jgi:hypothetical protein